MSELARCPTDLCLMYRGLIHDESSRKRLIDNVYLNRGRLVGHLYLGSTLTECVSSLARQLSRECGAQARPHSRGSPAR